MKITEFFQGRHGAKKLSFKGYSYVKADSIQKLGNVLEM